MNSDFNEVYNNFNENKKGNNTGKIILITALCSIICTILTICLMFSIPNVRKKLFSVETEIQTSSKAENKEITSTAVSQVSLTKYSDTAIYAANKVLPSIVGIKVKYNVTSNGFFGLSQQTAEASGSGIIISEDGYILTNNHIVNSTESSYYYEVSAASAVTVYLYNDSTPYEAEIIGTDEDTDLAIIKINKQGLTPVELGNSDDVSVGEFVLAIGNPLGLQSSVTSGIVSAVNREVTTEGKKFVLIQTDAAINSGNSGGALVNSEGKVIGINTLKLSGTGIEGMGFAIPINKTIDVYTQLINNGKVLRPFIGINGTDLDEKTASKYNLHEGIYIKSVESFSAAEAAGLKVGDVITKIDGIEVKTMDGLNEVKNKKSIGDTVKLNVYRNGETLEIELTLKEKP